MTFLNSIFIVYLLSQIFEYTTTFMAMCYMLYVALTFIVLIRCLSVLLIIFEVS